MMFRESYDPVSLLCALMHCFGKWERRERVVQSCQLNVADGAGDPIRLVREWEREVLVLHPP